MSPNWLAFISGSFIGAFLGLFIMGLLSVRRANDFWSHIFYLQELLNSHNIEYKSVSPPE